MSYVVLSNGIPFSSLSTSVRLDITSIAFETLQVSQLIVDGVGDAILIVTSTVASSTYDITSRLACPST
jgi:hypothetical protein